MIPTESAKKTKKFLTPPSSLHIIKKATLANNITHTNISSADSPRTANTHFTNKTNMTKKIIPNKLIPPSISPSHNNHHSKSAKAIYQIPTSIIQTQILLSTTSINSTLASSSQTGLQKQTSNTIPYIATPNINIKPKQKYTKNLLNR